MTYEAKNFDHLLGTPGFSDELMKNHFTLYQGYVTNTNKLSEILKEAMQGKFGTPEFAELKRRFGWEFNGMRLHELYYFGSMKKGGAKLEESTALYKKLAEDFGSYDNWAAEFKGTGMARGIGWTILYYDPEARRIFNVWINEHDLGHLAGCHPLLALDLFEHAYMLDYGLKKADYIEAFFKAIDWEAVSKRFHD